MLAAGTSDLPVAQEALLTARYLGRNAELVVDVGVAGLHRILAQVPRLRAAKAIVVAAGMDGALPSVVAGLVAAPVVAVPTSVGYGAAFEGLAALLTMLNACAPGVAVVNIDNGYGAGHLAAQIAAPCRTPSRARSGMPGSTPRPGSPATCCSARWSMRALTSRSCSPRWTRWSRPPSASPPTRSPAPASAPPRSPSR